MRDTRPLSAVVKPALALVKDAERHPEEAEHPDGNKRKVPPCSRSHSRNLARQSDKSRPPRPPTAADDCQRPIGSASGQLADPDCGQEADDEEDGA